METKQTNGLYDFGNFRLDAKNRLLYSADSGEQVALTLKEFEILLFFVRNHAQVIKRNDLLDAVWKDTFVEEGTLTRNISRLRKSLEAADTDGEKFIETLPKRGYRFLPRVVEADENDVLIVEEQTQMRVRIEETFDSETESANFDLAEENIEPVTPRALNPKPQVSTFKFLSLIFGATAIAAIAFIVYQNFIRQPAINVIAASSIKPFSGATGRENTPAFSPDGRQIAFAWDGGDGGDLDIYIRLVGAVEPVRLTDSEFTEQYPTFSPDGSQIAFVRSFSDHGEVVLIPALGGAERRVARLFSGFGSISFAPDGQNIAVIDTEDSNDGKQYAVYLINLQTGERRRLTAPAEFAGETTPRFSPDGKSLAFVRVFSDKNQDLFIAPTTGEAAPRQVTFDRSVIHSLTWNADGNGIFFVSYRGDPQPNVWRVAATGGEPKLVVTNGRDVSNLAASPDGKTLAFVENNRNTDIWSIAANQQTAKKFAASIYSEHDPNFSPDGSRVVFTSNRTGEYAIWLADADGGNLLQLTDSSNEVNSPRFSPDGSKVVYDGMTDRNSDIFVVSAEGGAARRVTETAARDFAPAWSADGKWIYFTSDRTGEMNIWKTPASGDGGDQAVQITRGGAYEAFAAPDGATVFYTKQVKPAELWSVPANGGTEKNLSEFIRAGFTGSWTLTRAGIYFMARCEDVNLNIKFYDFADGKIKNAVEDCKIPNNIFTNLDAPADGSLFLYATLDQDASNIMLAEISPSSETK